MNKVSPRSNGGNRYQGPISSGSNCEVSQPMTNHKEGRTNGYETTQKSGNTEGMIARNATTQWKRNK